MVLGKVGMEIRETLWLSQILQCDLITFISYLLVVSLWRWAKMRKGYWYESLQITLCLSTRLWNEALLELWYSLCCRIYTVSCREPVWVERIHCSFQSFWNNYFLFRVASKFDRNKYFQESEFSIKAVNLLRFISLLH